MIEFKSNAILLLERTTNAKKLYYYLLNLISLFNPNTISLLLNIFSDFSRVNFLTVLYSLSLDLLFISSFHPGMTLSFFMQNSIFSGSNQMNFNFDGSNKFTQSVKSF